MKYFEGNKIGSYNTLLIKRLPKSRAIFRCGFCDKIFESKISHIVDGSTSSCGCNRFKFKSGDKLGPYETIFLNRKEDDHKKGLFKCSFCGEIFENRIGDISNGIVKSCGCQHYDNLINKRFNKLTVIEKTEQRSGTSIVWKCLCDCGNICYISGNNLKNGHISSCGCIGKSNGENNNDVYKDFCSIGSKSSFDSIWYYRTYLDVKDNF